jgi:hypothetical protein
MTAAVLDSEISTTTVDVGCTGVEDKNRPDIFPAVLPFKV